MLIILLQVYLDTVPMPSMEVYSGNPHDDTQHFEDWMQTQCSSLEVELGKWIELDDNSKAAMFLGQLNTYFQKRQELLGDDDVYLFPRQRPNDSALEVAPFQQVSDHWHQHMSDGDFHHMQDFL